jgi:cell division septation protein DedD
VEREMGSTTPKINSVANIVPIPLNTYKTTLAIAPRKVALQSQEKIKSSENANKSSTLALFTVQVGAYKKKAYAQSLLKKLLQKGYKAFLVHKGTYKVQVDKFKNKQDAHKLAKQIQEKEKLKNFVARAG